MISNNTIECPVLPICDGELQIIYKYSKPYGIRDKGGLLFLFKDISKYDGQKERYSREIEQQYKLADYLLAALKDTFQKPAPLSELVDIEHYRR